MMMKDETVLVSSVLCLLYFSRMVLKWIQVSLLLFLSSSKWSWKKSIALHMTFNRPWRFNTLYGRNVMVLKGVNLMLFSTVQVSDGPERSQFCLYTQWSWKESILDADFSVYIPNGLERSHYCTYVLWSWKESNSDHLPYRPLRWSWKKSLLGFNFLLGLNLGLLLYPVGCQ